MYALKKKDYDLEKQFKCLKIKTPKNHVWTFFSITSL